MVVVYSGGEWFCFCVFGLIFGLLLPLVVELVMFYIRVVMLMLVFWVEVVLVVDIVLLLRIDGCFALGVCFWFCGACVFVYLVVCGVGIWIVFVSLVVACVCGVGYLCRLRCYCVGITCFVCFVIGFQWRGRLFWWVVCFC